MRAYLLVLAVLLALTGVTAGVAYVDLGGVANTVVAMVIAGIKAVLVLLFFMHMRGGARVNWAAIGTGLFLLAILVLLTIGDSFTRGWDGALPG